MKITFVILITTISISLFIWIYLKAQNHNNLSNSNATQPTGQLKQFMSRIEHLRHRMTNYMEAADPSYTEKDVVKCANILTSYLGQLEKTSSKKDGMLIVKSTVLKLNKLNESCGSELIETAEREEIAEIIILAGAVKGYNSKEYDTTEEWRDW